MSIDKERDPFEPIEPDAIPGPGSIINTGSAKPVQFDSKDPWIHRAEGMLCKTCMFYVAKLSTSPKLGPITGIGRCRKHAPTMSGYPVVFPTDWCGDHKLDENKT